MNSIVVTNKDELKDALDCEAACIVVKGSLAKKIKVLSKVKKISDKNKLSYNMTQGALVSTLVGVPTVVAITLIVTVGIVVVVAILKDYKIIYKNGDEEVILQRE